MENTEILTNNEVIEVAEIATAAGSRFGKKAIVLAGAAALIGAAAFAIKKLKAKKDQAEAVDGTEKVVENDEDNIKDEAE